MFKKSLTILLAFFVVSCAPKITDFHLYKPKILPKTSFMPTSDEVNGKTYKVVVFPLDEENNELAKQADLGSSLMVNVENVLSTNRLAQLVDRKAAAKLEKEIALAEMNKTGSYKGPQIADYAISGTISNASFTKTYSSASTFTDLNGLVNKVPASFTYTSEVSGNLKIYEIPSMTVVENFGFSGGQARSENVQADNATNVLGIAGSSSARSHSGFIGMAESSGYQVKGALRDDNLIRRAGQAAINSITLNIKNFFAKEGYILEKRALDDKTIFKINLGSADGIKRGDYFEIIGKYEVANSITGIVETEKRVIAQGRVADKIDPKSSWVVLDKEEDVDGIRLGDLVKLKYERRSFTFN